MKARRQTPRPGMVPAKISVPRLTETYARSRVFRALDAASRKKAVWIAAPAGAGKTSAVATYLSSRRLPTLWYNVDARDADVANLFHYLALAARRAAPRKKLDLPAFTADSQGAVAAFARGFFEALCRERPAPSLLVLDDYHEAEGQLWNEVIREAISALPEGVVAIIISRNEPPPALARHVASGEIGLVGWDELRLTPEETAGLVRLCRPDWRLSHVREVLPGIASLANGWAAALTLLLQNQHVGAMDPDGVEEFSERLFDYFATEILDKATVVERDFLFRTSIVPSLTITLAARLTGASDAARMLTDLGRRSFLTSRLGASGAYCYHPLLRGFLRRRAEHDLGAATLHELHRRAAEYFVETDQIDEAMEQLETADDVPVRTKLLLDVAPSYFAKGCGRTVETWIARLPPEVVEQSGWLTYWRALCSLGRSPSLAKELLERAFERFHEEADPGGLYQSCATAMQAIIHEGMDFAQLDAWIARCEELGESGPPCPQAFQPMMATGMLMGSMFGRADPSLHRYWVERAMQLAATCSDPGHRAMTGGFLAIYFVFNDYPAQAANILEMLRASAKSESSTIATLTMLQADALCAWTRGDNDTCLAYARDALSLAQRTGVFVWNDYLLGLGAAATLGSDDVDGAREFLQGLGAMAQRGARYSVGTYHFYVGWELSLRGDHERALRSAELAYETATALGYLFGMAICALQVAHRQWQTGRGQEAIETLARARRHAEGDGCLLVLFGCDLIEADALWSDDRARAARALSRGLALGRERGYFNTFLVENTMMARLAARALELQIEPDFVRAIIVKRKLASDSIPVAMEGWHKPYRVRALGAFELQRDRSAHTATADVNPPGGPGAPRGMPLRLLQATIALGARGVPEVELIDALWPDAEGDGGRRVFDTTLHRLRRQLGDDAVLRLIDGRLYLDERLCWVDVWAFEGTVAKVNPSLVDSASPTELGAMAEQLVDLYRGPLLADAPASSAFARGPRKKLATTFLRAANLLGKALELRGEFDRATSLYQRTVDGDQGVEQGYAGLMRCAAGAGRRADGLRLFEQCRARMLDDFGEEPGPELARLRARLSQDPPPQTT